MDGSLPGSIQQTEAEPKLEQGDQLGGYENNAEPTEQWSELRPQQRTDCSGVERVFESRTKKIFCQIRCGLGQRGVKSDSEVFVLSN